MSHIHYNLWKGSTNNKNITTGQRFLLQPFPFKTFEPFYDVGICIHILNVTTMSGENDKTFYLFKFASNSILKRLFLQYPLGDGYLWSKLLSLLLSSIQLLNGSLGHGIYAMNGIDICSILYAILCKWMTFQLIIFIN